MSLKYINRNKCFVISLMMLKFLLLSKPEYMPGLIYSTWYSNMRRSAKSLDFHEVWSGVIFWQYPGISDFAALRILRNFPRLENLWIHREIPFFRMTEITLLSGICKKTDISWSWNIQLEIHKKVFNSRIIPFPMCLEWNQLRNKDLLKCIKVIWTQID